MKPILAAVLFICMGAHQARPAKYQSLLQTSVTVDTVAPATSPAINYDTYCNSRFGYCIDYPKDVLFPQPESENNDGRVFKNKQGEKVLTVYGNYPVTSDNVTDGLKAAYQKELHASDANKDRVITYQKLGKTFYVISGYQNKKIFYHKTIIKGDALAHALLEYEEGEKDYYGKVLERVFGRFK